MTYLEAQQSLTISRILLQGANSRTTTLQSDIAIAVGEQDGLFNQIPDMPLGGYTDEPKEGFIQEVNDYATLAVSLSARIPE